MNKLKEIDYAKYIFGFWECVFYFTISIAMILVITFVFYEKLWWALIVSPLCLLIMKTQKFKLCEKRKRELLAQFKDTLMGMSVALSAGYSVENSIQEANKEMLLLYGEKCYMVIELKIIMQKMSMNIPISTAIEEFAQRADIEEIISFSQVFKIINKTGGDIREIIRVTDHNIGAKIDTEREIEVITNAKRYEHRIMTVIPIFIVMYIRISSPGFLDPLYGNILGVFIMSICLLLYMAAFILGEYLTKIEV